MSSSWICSASHASAGIVVVHSTGVSPTPPEPQLFSLYLVPLSMLRDRPLGKYIPIHGPWCSSVVVVCPLRLKRMVTCPSLLPGVLSQQARSWLGAAVVQLLAWCHSHGSTRLCFQQFDPEQLSTSVQLPTVTGSGLAASQSVRVTPLLFITGTSRSAHGPLLSSSEGSVGPVLAGSADPSFVAGDGAGSHPTGLVFSACPCAVPASPFSAVVLPAAVVGVGPAGVLDASSQAMPMAAHSAVARIHRVVIACSPSFPFGGRRLGVPPRLRSQRLVDQSVVLRCVFPSVRSVGRSSAASPGLPNRRSGRSSSAGSSADPCCAVARVRVSA